MYSHAVSSHKRCFHSLGTVTFLEAAATKYATPTLDKYRYQGQDTFPLATFCPTHVICQLGEYA